MDSAHPLQQLDGRPLGLGVLHLARLAPTAKSGWREFDLVLSVAQHACSPPVVRGVYSAGGKWVTPWIEIVDYRPSVGCGEGVVDLAQQRAQVPLFRLLADLLPVGAHLMLGCESPSHGDTYLALCRGVPPVATPLGQVLLEAGFPRVKFFDLPEGGKEGQKKLWAEKPLDDRTAAAWAELTRTQLRTFLQEPGRTAEEQARAEAALRHLERHALTGAP